MDQPDSPDSHEQGDRYESAPMIARSTDVVLVLSIERTATHSIYQALLDAKAAPFIRHSHYLNTEKDRGLQAEEATLKMLRLEEEQTRRFLAAKSLRRVIFTILRDPRDRIASCMWYGRGEKFAELYDSESDTFAEETGDLVDHYVRRYGNWGRKYGIVVYKKLGLGSVLAPGRYETPHGIVVHALNFDTLSEDFGNATEMELGCRLAVARMNTGEQFGDGKLYRRLRQFFFERWPQERLAACFAKKNFRIPWPPVESKPEIATELGGVA